MKVGKEWVIICDNEIGGKANVYYLDTKEEAQSVIKELEREKYSMKHVTVYPPNTSIGRKKLLE
jgi:hypothetical protein